MMKTKACSTCKKRKLLTSFPKQQRNQDGLAYACKACKNAQSRAYRQTPEGKASEARRPKSRARYAQIKSRYGLDAQQYHALVDGKVSCQICQRLFAGREPALDHCHATKRVRGLLCLPCNSLLGYAKDNVLVLLAAVEYLESSASSVEYNACGAAVSPSRKTRQAAMKQEPSRSEAV